MEEGMAFVCFRVLSWYSPGMTENTTGIHSLGNQCSIQDSNQMFSEYRADAMFTIVMAGRSNYLLTSRPNLDNNFFSVPFMVTVAYKGMFTFLWIICTKCIIWRWYLYFSSPNLFNLFQLNVKL